MAIVVPNIGELNQLDEILDGLLAAGLVRLFANNYTPIATTVYGDFTEATYSGYAGSETPGWTAVATDGSGRAYTVSDVIPYAHDGGGTANTVYGYYVTDASDNLLFAERFATPIVMDDATDIFSLQITYRLREDS